MALSLTKTSDLELQFSPPPGRGEIRDLSKIVSVMKDPSEKLGSERIIYSV